ncbi:hypothetical protein HanXRQr2_Chr10g0455381 [Helianthus annuus]|uniref:Uncharacterized protein n=1 Tax=Helianthus annuus TaxID=4232 RepID=A0A251TNQ7_HELAN|nr:hypothetical protein HanXRQr2_Chr10g0455381 [Helianthus annuus]KAJ0514870.1 hypothetical protein HanHA300_Chr10g0374421 [Helianthus annuus]KAJ0531034.1 hypothetical protein HanHA89_Chr10g0396641 [Helianthus annuus]KAJ0884956.1 hypothetical protein HanPSC8_Chr10g0439821 [Helianthus annuus]
MGGRGFSPNRSFLFLFLEILKNNNNLRALYPLISKALLRYYNQEVTKESPIIAM